MRPTKNRGRTRLLLLLSFGGIAALSLLVALFGYFHARSVDNQVDLVVKDAIVSVRLVGRMGLDVEEERALIHRHIFEHEAREMLELEKRIDAVRNDYASAAREYAPLAEFPAEAETWHRLNADRTAVEPQLALALQLSRSNEDAEAARVMGATEPAFDAINRDVAELVDINQVAANRASATVEHLLARSHQVRLLFAATTVVFTFILGLWITGIISRNERRLEHQTAELETMNRDLGRAAHDLRDPLSTMSVATSILEQRSPHEAQTTSLLRRAIDRMTAVVEDLVQLSHLSAPLTGNVARTERVAAALDSDLRPMMATAGGVLRIDVEPASVRSSDGLLQQALSNLADNAIKYRRLGVTPELEIVGRAKPQMYELRVSDNGLGLAPDEIGRAFEPFFRSERTRSIPGTGLGLSIVHRIVEASGGRVSVESHLGQGTTFVIHLPLERRSSLASGASAASAVGYPRGATAARV